MRWKIVLFSFGLLNTVNHDWSTWPAGEVFGRSSCHSGWTLSDDRLLFWALQIKPWRFIPHSFPVINTVKSIKPNSWGGNRWPLKSLKLKLFMGISDKIKAATIKFDTVSQEMMAKKVAEKCAACSGFFFLLYKHVAFLFFSFLSSSLWLQAQLQIARSFNTSKKSLICDDFIENQKFDGKHVTKTTSTGTYRQAQSWTFSRRPVCTVWQEFGCAEPTTLYGRVQYLPPEFHQATQASTSWKLEGEAKGAKPGYSNSSKSQSLQCILCLR